MIRPSIDDLRWTRLLQWLEAQGMNSAALTVERRYTPGAGHGLFLLDPCDTGVPLFTIPAKALMNRKTLLPHYLKLQPDPSSLTAVQLLSLHLYLNKPPSNGESSDPLFGPYISILPREFDNHPLTWSIQQDSGVGEHRGLLKALPSTVSLQIQEASAKFYSDWSAVQPYLIGSILVCSASLKAFLWAWLNVNTRCIYHRIQEQQSHPDNITLCPVLDFANHTHDGVHMTLAKSTRHGLTILSPSKASVAGSELFLKYGHHSNTTLFVEYGFINDFNPSRMKAEPTDLEIDIQPQLERLFITTDDSNPLIETLLRQDGYWGDWTLHMLPLPAHPSWRVISSLRLFSLLQRAPNPGDDIDIHCWRQVILGKREVISLQNEEDWRKVLGAICQDIAENSAERLRELARDFTECKNRWWLENVRLLWAEEEVVANAVSHSLANGEEF